MNGKLIFIVDDDPAIIEELSEYLTEEGYSVKGFSGAEVFFGCIEKEKPDLVLLDLMLPGIDGFEICKRLKERERFLAIPIIMLTGRRAEPDKISGLNMGADDYVVKPFSLNELGARIKAVLRRNSPDKSEQIINIGNILVMDLATYKVTVFGKKVDITATEFRILELLASQKGHVFTRERLLDYLWGTEKDVTARSVDVHIKHLRDKLGKAGDLIKNARGVGYKLDENE